MSPSRMMAIGREHTLLLSNVAQPTFDYIALGHLHKHQVLSEHPPVVYAGSLERVDFSEENDEKGFYVVDVEPSSVTAERHVSYEFHPVSGRRFLTININLEPDDIDPMATVLRAVAGQETSVRDAIVRLNLSLPAQIESQFRDNDLRDALKTAHYFAINRDIKRETRLRLGDRTAEELTPLDALKAYLESKKVSPERQKVLLEYGEKLIERSESD